MRELERRIERLENPGNGCGMFNLPQRLGAARKRWDVDPEGCRLRLDDTFAELDAEQQGGRLYGLRLRIYNAMSREREVQP